MVKYTVGQSKGAKRRAIELEAGLSGDIRLLMGPTPVGVGAGEDRIGGGGGGGPQGGGGGGASFALLAVKGGAGEALLYSV